MKKKIAITGGIGSGKSVAASYLASLGYPVFSCDEIYKEIFPTPNYVEKIAKLFPETVKNNQIDKYALSALVFNNQENLRLLNSVAHPIIMDTLLKKMEEENSNLIFAEVPLLFEGGFENLFDNVLVILRGERERTESLILRDGLSKTEIQARINSQLRYNSKEGEMRLKNCNAYLIENNADINTLQLEIDKFLSLL